MAKEVRSHVVNIRVTEKEWAKVDRLSEKLDMTKSSYIQFLIQKAQSVPNRGFKK